MSSEVANAARYLIVGLKTGALDEAQVDKLVRAVGETQRGATPEESAAALVKLSEGLELPDTASAEIAARVLGAMIEAGHDPVPARDQMLGCLRRILPLSNELADVVRPQVGEPPTGMSEYAAGKWVSRRANEALRRAAGTMPEASEAWERLQAIWPGAIALLSADPQGRAEAAVDLLPLAAELQDVHEAAGWLTAMLSVVNEAPFVAIEPAARIGIRGEMSGVVDNFQLNVLLMEAVPWTSSRRVSRAAAATARGEGPQQCKENVEGVWDLYSYAALEPDGTLPEPPDGDEIDETLIWDEGMPAHIPVLDGHHIILLGPTAYERSWRAQRMFVNLPATLAHEVLDEEAVAEWLTKIGAAARLRR